MRKGERGGGGRKVRESRRRKKGREGRNEVGKKGEKRVGRRGRSEVEKVFWRCDGEVGIRFEEEFSWKMRSFCVFSFFLFV